MRRSIILAAATVAATLAACAEPSGGPVATELVPGDSILVDGILLRGRSALAGDDGDTLVLAVELKNRRPDSVEVDYGACDLDLRLVRPGGSADRPAYASSARPDSSIVRLAGGRRGVVYFACPLYLAHTIVAPGGSIGPAEFRVQAALDSVAADSLRGTFRVVARTHLFDRSFDVPAGTIRLR